MMARGNAVPLTQNRECAIRIDLSQPREGRGIDGAVDIFQLVLKRRGVVVVAGFAIVDELGHHPAGAGGVLELITAGADRHVEAVDP